VKLHIDRRHSGRRVSGQSIMDYRSFTDRFYRSAMEEGIRPFERFIAARSLVQQGLDTYLDPSVTADDGVTSFRADACGIGLDTLVAAFCVVGIPNDEQWDSIRQVNASDNGSALIISRSDVGPKLVELQVPGALSRGKVRLETLRWFEDTFESALQETLRTIELLANETRMRMLAPLLQKSALKRDFRAKINPKLVYSNLTVLSQAGLVDEPVDGTYELSELGKTVMADFIAFLERTRKTLDVHKGEEVKLIGRR
jgi:DNA-binding transcriptional ArsR family regulator